MSEGTNTFNVNVILTVTTHRLLTRPKDGGNGIGDLYEILNWMTNDNLYTHQLVRSSKECEPWLLRWFPELAKVNLGELDKLRGELSDWNNILDQWISLQRRSIPELKLSYDVPRIPMDDHDIIDPMKELVEMVGEDKVIVVETTDE